MKTHHLAHHSSLLHNFLAEIRDVSIQNDRMRFRKNIERTGEIMAYEMSKELNYRITSVETPLGLKKTTVLNDDVIICGILRAGLALHQAFLNYFDSAENAFVSAYRHHKPDSNDFEILVEYLACPPLEGKTLVLVDPMLATGRSFVAAYNALQQMGNPDKIHLAAIVAAPEGIDYVSKHFPDNTTLWTADIDDGLNEKGYILPGLGDAGDLSYGSKLQH